MPHFTAFQWFLAIIGAMGVGVAKSGFSGVSLLHVLIFASLFTAKESTGVVLPMLIFGDVCAVCIFRRHARWEQIRRLLLPTALGVIIGAFLVRLISETQFRPVIGAVILSLTALQLLRIFRPQLFEHVPHRLWFAWTMGLAAGVTTMLANAAGPITALYLLAISLPKFELVGTSAWLFFVINCFKVPFSVALGLIHRDTLLLNAALIPAILCGLFAGRWLVTRLPQRLFDTLLLAFAGFAAARMLGVIPFFDLAAHPVHDTFRGMLLKFLGKYRDIGLLILRIGLGIMFCLHGLPKLHGGPKTWVTYGHAMGLLGIHFLPVFWGFMAAVTECIGGILLVLGFAYRPVCLLLTFTMFVASLKTHHERADFQATASRPIEMVCVFFAMAIIGPGRFSIDKD